MYNERATPKIPHRPIDEINEFFAVINCFCTFIQPALFNANYIH